MDASFVKSVFHSASSNYDVMNDFMSLGMHYHWKSIAVDYTQLSPGDQALDLAAGTGDITYYLQKKYGLNINIVAADPCEAMLQRGRARLLDAGLYKQIHYCHCFAENLPFQTCAFSLVICAFGFRNFSDKLLALHEIYRIIEPGGQLVILEFSHPKSSVMKAAYQVHSEHIIPMMCRSLGANIRDYDYLIDSISAHPDQTTVLNMIKQVGFVDCRVTNFLSGIVSIHRAIKPL